MFERILGNAKIVFLFTINTDSFWQVSNTSVPMKRSFFNFVTCKCKTMKGSTCERSLGMRRTWHVSENSLNMEHVILLTPSVHRLDIILK